MIISGLNPGYFASGPPYHLGGHLGQSSPNATTQVSKLLIIINPMSKIYDIQYF